MKGKLLVLEGKMDRINRIKAMNVVTSLGGKVRHDSGGRIILIDTLGKDKKILGKLPKGAKLVSVDQDVKSYKVDLDPSEILFLDALKKRNSKDYRSAKKRQKSGETPEEKELFTAPCIEEE